MPINQLAIYALILVLGWLLGLLSRSGGGKWRKQYHNERTERMALEKAHTDNDTALRTRIAELERRAATPAPVAPVIAAPLAADTIAPAAPSPFATPVADTPAGDDLTRIHGIGHDERSALTDAGITRFVDLSRLSDDEAAALETRLRLQSGTIARGEWREQAALLATGRDDEHRTRFSRS